MFGRTLVALALFALLPNLPGTFAEAPTTTLEYRAGGSSIQVYVSPGFPSSSAINSELRRKEAEARLRSIDSAATSFGVTAQQQHNVKLLVDTLNHFELNSAGYPSYAQYKQHLAALNALNNLPPPETKSAIPTLINMVAAPYTHFSRGGMASAIPIDERFLALQALSKHGADAAAVIPAAEKLLNDPIVREPERDYYGRPNPLGAREVQFINGAPGLLASIKAADMETKRVQVAAVVEAKRVQAAAVTEAKRIHAAQARSYAVASPVSQTSALPSSLSTPSGNAMRQPSAVDELNETLARHKTETDEFTCNLAKISLTTASLAVTKEPLVEWAAKEAATSSVTDFMVEKGLCKRLSEGSNYARSDAKLLRLLEKIGPDIYSGQSKSVTDALKAGRQEEERIAAKLGIPTENLRYGVHLNPLLYKKLKEAAK